MNKKLFSLLIALMSLSLLGIIFVQVYWINNAYTTKQEQLASNVKQVLVATAEKIENREIQDYYAVYSKIVNDSTLLPDTSSFTELVYKTENPDNNEITVFTDGILAEDYKLSSSFLDLDLDTIQFKKLINKKTKTVITPNLDGIGEARTFSEEFIRLPEYEKKQFEDAYKKLAVSQPIHRRVKHLEIEHLIREGLNEFNIKSKFEYAVYSKNLLTKIHSRKFKLDPETTYKVPIFVGESGEEGYQLYVNFSGKKKEVFNSILGMALLSLVFTTVIILAFWSALSQLFKQRQISQIKTDFINNMTHEFKTPIATINLALDALKNPKVKDNKEFLTRYLGMIREENKRMHAQVENVLRISKLEKNELDIPKERVKIHEIVEDAISHVNLIVQDKGGYINTHFDAFTSTVLGSDLHLTNVIVNLFDNAIKYSDDEPKIDVYTENVKNSIILKIQDQGMGMSKTVQKKIFEKFYREHTGNIHNVKGHGLGLAYVKRILDDHDAEIFVESDKGKGSTFILKLHLIS